MKSFSFLIFSFSPGCWLASPSPAAPSSVCPCFCENGKNHKSDDLLCWLWQLQKICLRCERSELGGAPQSILGPAVKTFCHYFWTCNMYLTYVIAVIENFPAASEPKYLQTEPWLCERKTFFDPKATRTTPWVIQDFCLLIIFFIKPSPWRSATGGSGLNSSQFVCLGHLHIT